MKKFILLTACSFMIAFSGCRPKTDCNSLYELIKAKSDAGEFLEASELADSLRANCADAVQLIMKSDSLVEINNRIRLDFSLTENDFLARVERNTGKQTDSALKAWNDRKWIEWRMIDGKKMYFNRAASNLVLLRDFYENREEQDRMTYADSRMKNRLQHSRMVVKSAAGKTSPVCPVTMNIRYTITVLPDAVPGGETVRCWLPFPKENHARQNNVEFLSASEPDYIIAPDSLIHRSVYMEKKAVSDSATIFTITFRYTSSAVSFDPEKINALPYDMESNTYKIYTAEELPDICFTENVKRIADSITSPEDSPVEMFSKIYLWFKQNIQWTGALEYSVMPNIPEYVLQNMRGDCGMQTFLYMSMLRYKGIPVRWQSGWMVPPDNRNLHDWCEVYFEGTGWVPSDVSYDLQDSDERLIRQFYMSGIDSYRMIVNDGVAGPLFPGKKFMRSEPFDFQRGEVEWKGGNLYFDKWDYKMEIEYVE